MSLGILQDAETIVTKDSSGKINGSITELFKNGEKTLVYITASLPGQFKGYHLHRIRVGRYFVISGKVKIILWRPGTQEKEEYVLDAAKPQRLTIPKDVAAGILNIGEIEARIVNFPDPPFDPNLKDEQVEYTEEELKSGVVK